jgi:hypothetical protein
MSTAGHFIPWENPDAWVNDLRRISTAAAFGSQQAKFE